MNSSGIDYAATANRQPWDALPVIVQSRILEAVLARGVLCSPSEGSPSAAGAGRVSVDVASGGFTDGFAAVVTYGERRAFVKATSTDSEHIFASYVREAEVLQVLPAEVTAPELIAAFLVPHQDANWQVLLTRAVLGHMPGRPWTHDDLARVESACIQYEQALTPAPPELELSRMIDHWTPGSSSMASFRFLMRGEIDAPWLGRTLNREQLGHLDQLTWLAPQALEGECAVHNDLRADNIVIDSGGAAFIVDWNWLTTGPIWSDWLYVLMQAHGQGLDVDSWILRSSLTRDVPAEFIDSWYSSLLSYMIAAGNREVPTSPFLQLHRQNEARSLMAILSHRLGWEL